MSRWPAALALITALCSAPVAARTLSEIHQSGELRICVAGTSAAFYQIVIGDPEIANVNPLTDKSFYVLGNNLGTTGVALFDENKQLVGTVDIEVTLDTDQLASTIRASVPDANIKVGSANGRVVLSGEADDAVAAEKANQIATRFSGKEDVINSVNISSSQQVQLNVRFVEVNRQIGHELGWRRRPNVSYEHLHTAGLGDGKRIDCVTNDPTQAQCPGTALQVSRRRVPSR